MAASEHLPKLRTPHTYLSWPASRAAQSTSHLGLPPRPLLPERALARRVSAWQHVVRRQYVSLTASLPGTEVFYTVKANLAPEVLSLLIKLGSNFDVASRGENRATCWSRG